MNTSRSYFCKGYTRFVLGRAKRPD